MAAIAIEHTRFGQHRLAYAHHAQYRFSSTRPPCTRRKCIFFAVFGRHLVEYLNQNGEADGCIQIAFRNFHTQAFGYQTETNHQQETQAQHHHGRVVVHKRG